MKINNIDNALLRAVIVVNNEYFFICIYWVECWVLDSFFCGESVFSYLIMGATVCLV